MENATDALKIAFAVFTFVIALTIAVSMFAQLNQVSKVVLASSDITTFYTYIEADENLQKRTVGLETIIPTLYKYYRENYTVLFLDKDGDPLPLYNSQTDRSLWGSGTDPATNQNDNAGIIAKYYTDDADNYTDFYKNWDNLYDKKAVCSFDVDEETIRHEPWTGSTVDFKENLDTFLFGGTFEYPSGNGSYSYNKGFADEYSDDLFTEMLGEYYYNIDSQEGTSEENLGLQKNRKKRVIIYQLQ